MLYVRRLMKVAVTVVTVIPLLFCRDFFVAGGIGINYIFRNHMILPDTLIVHIAGQVIGFWIASLVLTTAILYTLLRAHRWIDRAMDRYT